MLRQTLRNQTSAVEVRDALGKVRGLIAPAGALDLVIRGAFLGVGTTACIRYIRPVQASKAGVLAEDDITTVGLRLRPELRTHHERHCAAYQCPR